jgi:hypothetical protein
MNMKKLYTYLIFSIIIASVFAQAPKKMSYQAVIRNNNKVLITNKKVSMIITILQDKTPVYVELHDAITNDNGLVSVAIGNGVALTGTFAAIDWSIGTHYIKTETDPTGGSDYSVVGESELLSVPYALFAANAGSNAGTVIQDTRVLNSSTWSSEKISTQLDLKASTSSLSTVAFTGSFKDLTNKPTTLAGYGITDGGLGAGPLLLDNGSFFVGDMTGKAISTAKNAIPLSGFAYPNSNVSMGNGSNNFRITNLADPASSQDAATKSYVDSKLSSGTGGGSSDPFLTFDAAYNLSINGKYPVSLSDLNQSLSLAGTVLSISGPRNSHVDLAGILAGLGSSGSGSGVVAHDATLIGNGISTSPLGISNQGITPLKLAGVNTNGTNGQVLTSNGSGSFVWADLASGTGGGLTAVTTFGGLSSTTNSGTANIGINDGGLFLTKIAPIAGSTIIGNSSTSYGYPTALPMSSIKTMLALTKSDVGLGNVQNVDQTNASNLISGTIPAGRFASATIPANAIIGNGDATTYLRGDGTWGAPAGGGSSVASGISTTLISGVTGTNVQTALEGLKTLIDVNTTNLTSKMTGNAAITGATKTKITYDAKGLVTAGTDATTADISDSSNKRYVTDAQLSILANTSGKNTGDQIALTVPVTPTGLLVSTNVQAALEELQGEISTSASGGLTAVSRDGTLKGDGNSTPLGLSAVGTASTYRSVTTDAQGRVVSGTNPTTIAEYGITDAKIDNLSDVSIVSKQNNDALVWDGSIWTNKPLTSVIPLATTSVPGLLAPTDKSKLDGLTNYVLPIASSSALGGVKVGSTLTIDGSGVLDIPGTVGDITSVTAGAGLAGGSLTGDATLGFAPISNKMILGNFSGATAVPGPLNDIQVKSLLSLDQVKNYDQTNATNITSGVLDVARLGDSSIPLTKLTITGTPVVAGAATYLSGNGRWELLAANSVSGVLPVANGGTGISSYTTGNYIKASGATTLTQIAPTSIPADIGLGNVDNTHDKDKIVSDPTKAALLLKEDVINKSNDVNTDATSTDKYPSVKAIKTYVDTQVSAIVAGGASPATNTVSGTIKLAGDISGSADAPTVPGLLLKENAFTVLPVSKGGTGMSSYTAGSFIYANSSSTLFGLTSSQVKTNLGLDNVVTASDLASGLATKINTVDKGAINGIATLDATGKIPTSQIPVMPATQVYVVADEPAMLAISNPQVGSTAIQTSTSKSYILAATPGSVIGNWQQLGASGSGVQSVNGHSGTAVNVTLADLNAASATDLTNGLALKQDKSNISTNVITDAVNDTKYPSVNAIKTYVDNKIPAFDASKIGNMLTVLTGTTVAWQPAPAGSVTGLTIISNNGITNSVTNSSISPFITLGLGSITPLAVSATGNITTTNGNITTTSGNISAGGTITASNISGTNTGDQTISLTGEVTATGSKGVLITSITPGAVTYSKIQPMTGANLLLGSGSSGTAVREITLGSNLSFSGNQLNATGGGGSGTVTSLTGSNINGVTTTIGGASPTVAPVITVSLGDIKPSSVTATGSIIGSNISGTTINTGDQQIVLSGDLTGSAGSGTVTTIPATIGAGKVLTTHLAPSAVTAAKIADQTITDTKLSGISTSGVLNQVLTAAGSGGFKWTTLSGTGDMSKATYDPTSAVNGQVVGLTAIQTLTNKTLTNPIITNPTGIVKVDVGLGLVDNTADASKNVASAITATKLTPGRKINGVSFDGTTDITISSAITDPTLSAISTLPSTGFIVHTATGATTRSLINGTGISITNPDGVSVNPTIALAPVVGLTPGPYTSADITVDAYGRITTVNNGTGSGGTATTLSYAALNDRGTVTLGTSTTADILAATNTKAGLLLPTDFIKLTNMASYSSSDKDKVLTISSSGTASWALPPSATVLGYTASPNDGRVNNTNNLTYTTIPLVNGTNAGLMVPADFTKLGKITDIASGTIDQNKVLTVNGSGIATWVTPAVAAGTNITYTAYPAKVTIGSSTGTSKDVLPADATNAGLLLPADFTKLTKIPTITNSPSATNTVLTATSATSATWSPASSGGTTNLGFTTTATDGSVTSSTGTAAPITAATSTKAGLMIATDKVKLDNIATPPAVVAQVLTSKADGTTEWKAPAAGGGGGSTLQAYHPGGNNAVTVRATGLGIGLTMKTGFKSDGTTTSGFPNLFEITVPAGVFLQSLQIVGDNTTLGDATGTTAYMNVYIIYADNINNDYTDAQLPVYANVYDRVATANKLRAVPVVTPVSVLIDDPANKTLKMYVMMNYKKWAFTLGF